MSAKVRQARTQSARTLAERMGVCERTIRNWQALPREEWLVQRRQMKADARMLRDEHNMSPREIAEAMGLKITQVYGLLRERA